YAAPENLSGEIRKYEPDHLIIIDAADIGKEPGDVAVFTPENCGGMSFSTHRLPIKVLAQYLEQSFKCSIMIIGIQPKDLGFGGPVSKEVEASARNVSKAVKEAVSQKS
ncbi:MAG: hydrogenase maturation protease, partial [bacterium]